MTDLMELSKRYEDAAVEQAIYCEGYQGKMDAAEIARVHHLFEIALSLRLIHIRTSRSIPPK